MYRGVAILKAELLGVVEILGLCLCLVAY